MGLERAALLLPLLCTTHNQLEDEVLVPASTEEIPDPFFPIGKGE